MASLSNEKDGIFRIHWRFKVRVGPRAGEIIRGSLQLGRCTKAAAKSKLHEINDWEHRVRTGRHIPGCSFQTVRDAWLRERELTCTPQTLQRTKRVLAMYVRWRESHNHPCATVANVAAQSELTAWRDFRLEYEAGRKTVSNDFSTLSAFFDWCVLEKYIHDNPIARIAIPRFVTKKEGTPLTRTQAGQWLRRISPRKTRGGSGPRNWSEVRRKRQICVFFLNTGLRNGELCSASIEDLRVDEDSQLLYVMGKGLKERWVPLNNAAMSAIRLHLRSRGNPRSGPLFVSQSEKRYNVRQLANEISRTLDDRKMAIRVNPHNLRHTFATWLARSISDVSIAQKILGHENVNTTLKYYVHTGDYELAGATACLRGRQFSERKQSLPSCEEFKIIPFPSRQVS